VTRSCSSGVNSHELDPLPTALVIMARIRFQGFSMIIRGYGRDSIRMPSVAADRALTSCTRPLALKFHQGRSSGRISAGRQFCVHSKHLVVFPSRLGHPVLPLKGDVNMSNHFTGLSLGAPLGDFRLDLCDLYAFQSPSDPSRTVIILNANPEADALHPDAIYRVNIDTDGDYLADIAISYLFAPPNNGSQTFSALIARGEEARSEEAVGTKVVDNAPVSFGDTPEFVTAGDYKFFAGSRSDAFFFDFPGLNNIFDLSNGNNFTTPRLFAQSPWTGADSGIEANVFSTVLELPTSEFGPDPTIRIWGRCSLRRDGRLLHVDRAGHPSMSSFFNRDETKEEWNASEPVHDRERWLDPFVQYLGHIGNYTPDEAVAAIDAEGLLPDVLTFDPSKPAQYPNGRNFSDDVIYQRLAFLSKGNVPSPGLQPHTDLLGEFPYLGNPHPSDH
jgi:Domain of unknown function (DUF4331)